MKHAHSVPQLLGITAVGVMLAALTSVPRAQGTLTITFPSRLAAGPDYATDVLKDPWDMSNAADVSPDPTEFGGWANFSVSGGLAGGTTTLANGFIDTSMSLIYRGIYTIVNPGKNGVNFPIDTSTYRKLGVRISDSGNGENPQIYWFHNAWGDPAAVPSAFGDGVGVRFIDPTTNGFKIITADMTQNNAGVPWTQGVVRGFRIDPNSDETGQDIFVDWVRLTYADNAPGAAMQTISWTGGSGTATIDVIDAGGTTLRIASGVSGGTYNWNYGVLPPGSYTLRVTTTGGSTSDKSFTINNPTSIRVTSPSRTSGEDYATTVLGNPWDMSSSADVQLSSSGNLTGVTFSGGQMHATNTNGDPSVSLVASTNNAVPIDTSKYRYLTYSLQVEGAYDLANGSVARVFWASAPGLDGATATTTKDIIVWPGVNSYTIDLASLSTAPNGGLESSGAAEPWTTNNKRHFRLDPHEFDTARTFHIDDVKLTATPVSHGTFTISFTGSDADAGDTPTVTLYYDTDQDPANGKTMIVSGLAMAAGSYVWDTSALALGTYYIYAEANDGVQTTGSYGDAPLNRTIAPCVFSLSASSAAAPYAGGAASVNVVASAPTCAWAATSNASFVTITSGASGTGNGTVSYTVARNPARPARTGTLTIAGLTFTISQAGAATPGDFDGDARADYVVYRPGSGIWSTVGQPDRQWGLPGDIPVPGDYNGDQVLDTAVYRPSTGQWFIQGQATIQWGRTGDIPVPADYNGDGVTDPAVYRTTDGVSGVWFVRGQFTASWGLRGDIPLPADFDGDGRADLAVYRRATGTWYVAYAATSFSTNATFQWGLVGDLPVPGDFDGDQRADLAVFRPRTSAWFIAFSTTNYTTSLQNFGWGIAGDVPFAADFTGDGVDELAIYRPSDGSWVHYNRIINFGTVQAQGGGAGIPVAQRPRFPVIPTSDFDGDRRSDVTVFRPSTGMWFTRSSTTNYSNATQTQWGLNGDVRVAGDYDGDGRTDHAVYRPSNGLWFVRFASTGATTSLQWGLSNDVPVPADYDGDGRTDVAVYRPSSGHWFVRRSSTNYTTSFSDQWGLSTDVAVPADYDGDGRADLAVFRPSTGQWFLKLTTTTFGATIVKQWGLSTDVPVPADYDGDGRADLTIYRPSSGQWLGVDALTNLFAINRQWGLSSDTPVPHDYDGDGAIDAAVYRPAGGEWFVRFSSTPANSGAFLYLQWGLPSDQPH